MASKHMHAVGDMAIGKMGDYTTPLYPTIAEVEADMDREELAQTYSSVIDAKISVLREAAHSGWFGTSAQSTLLRMADLLEKEGEYPVSGKADHL